MKRLFLLSVLVLSLLSCNNQDATPDVTHIKVELEVQHFEDAFFSVDTTKLEASLQTLHSKYPRFTTDFLSNILELMPQKEVADLKSFYKAYQPLYKSSTAIFKKQSEEFNTVKNGLQLVKYYFPEYPLPKKLITFVGPINSFATIITEDAIAIGLQLFMGKDHPLYTSEQGQMLYPAYVSRRFEPAYIPVSAMNAIVMDLYPGQHFGKPLIAQMVELGKKMYLTDHLLPTTADSLIIGYPQKQLDACYANEKNIWAFFVQNDMLYKTDPQLIREYVTDGPFTNALGKDSPGNIGQFVGWQIVKKWVSKNKGISMDSLMKKDPVQLFEESRYKPG